MIDEKPNDDDVARCRRVREELQRRFGTLDGYCDYLAARQRARSKGRARKKVELRLNERELLRLLISP